MQHLNAFSERRRPSSACAALGGWGCAASPRGLEAAYLLGTSCGHCDPTPLQAARPAATGGLHAAFERTPRAAAAVLRLRGPGWVGVPNRTLGYVDAAAL
jgi:hypothetical protein